MSVSIKTLVVSPLTQLQVFGITTALGIFYAFILVMTLVPAIRTLLDKRLEKKNKIDTDAFASSGEKLFNKISASTSIIPKKLKLVAIILILGIGGYGYLSLIHI